MANPTANQSGGEEEGGASASDLKQAHETIMQLQSELKDLKKKVQTQTLKGYNSSKKNMGNKSSKLKSKKTFAGKDGATDESASLAVEGANPMLKDQDTAYGGDDKNELI
jgi:FtsZ-binding cell division protein ZapB